MISEKRLVQTFLDLVRINAPAKEEKPVARFLRERLKRYSVREDNAGKAVGSNCGNILVRVSGDARPPILFSAHMDTVRPTAGIKPIVENGVIRTDGKTILGADDRAGIAMILEMLEHLREEGRPHPPLELAFTIAEEIGLQGAKQIRKGTLRSAMGYILDSSLPIGAAVNRAVTIQRMIITVKGKAAHAGVEPEKGINAIAIAARALSKVKTGRLDRTTTFNIGTISGGHAFNIVPHEAKVVVEARSASPEKLAKIITGVRKAFTSAANSAGGKVAFDEWTDFKLFRIPETAPVSKVFLRAVKAMGRRPELCQYGGGSDGNIFNAMGIPCLTLGLGYKFPHTFAESMRIADMVAGTRLLAELVKAY